MSERRTWRNISTWGIVGFLLYVVIASFVNPGTINRFQLGSRRQDMRFSPFAKFQALATLVVAAFLPSTLHAQKTITGQAVQSNGGDDH